MFEKFIFTFISIWAGKIVLEGHICYIIIVRNHSVVAVGIDMGKFFT